ncbi:PAS domain-containing protein [Halobacillus litoralis]|uniref:PAS domain-containing protein n=1 Tax=Halobacillus litoralis TaxID=45668 RepID=UPI001CD348EA|nr:PAS domain S-box protein [Halobacillus litoralis]MCA0970959.1 PAS domain-containing protein [Halobacillus litoralis]
MQRIIDFFHTSMGDDPTFLKDLMDGVTDFIFIMKKEKETYCFEFVNKAALEKLRMQQTWHRKALNEILPEDEAGCWTENCDKAEFTRKSCEVERDSGVLAGRTVWKPLFNQKGICTYIVSVTCKERKQRKEIYESLMKEKTDAFLVLSPEGHVLGVNTAFEEKFGWSDDELHDRHLPFVPDHLEQEHQALLQDVLNGQFIKSYTTVRKTKDGEWRNAVISMYPHRNVKGKIVGISAIIR